MHIYPYNRDSASAKALADALNIKRAKHDSVVVLKTNILINWGASKIDRKIDCPKILNKPEAVAKAANKLEAFKELKERVSIPDFTESLEEASKWLDGGSRVVARTVLNGHSGAGIVIVDPDSGEQLPEAKLYTLYVPKSEEYRIHVFNGGVIHCQRKARNKEVPDEQVNWKVRNHANGFIFAHQGVAVPAEGAKSAIDSVAALGLDFGAVDLIYNKMKNKFYVLEVNTACGLEGTTLERYVRSFKGLE